MQDNIECLCTLCQWTSWAVILTFFSFVSILPWLYSVCVCISFVQLTTASHWTSKSPFYWVRDECITCLLFLSSFHMRHSKQERGKGEKENRLNCHHKLTQQRERERGREREQNTRQRNTSASVVKSGMTSEITTGLQLVLSCLFSCSEFYWLLLSLISSLSLPLSPLLQWRRRLRPKKGEEKAARTQLQRKYDTLLISHLSPDWIKQTEWSNCPDVISWFKLHLDKSKRGDNQRPIRLFLLPANCAVSVMIQLHTFGGITFLFLVMVTSTTSSRTLRDTESSQR